MKKLTTIILTIFILTFFLQSCKKNYLTGGTILKPNVNVSTYDYLKTNPLFDTLVLLIDKAELKNEINESITFFAPTDYAIKKLLELRTVEIQLLYNNENIKYTIDSFPKNELKDSLRAYIFTKPIVRNDLLLNKDAVYKNKVNQEFSILLREISAINSGASTNKPQILNLVKIIKTLDPKDENGFPIDGIPFDERDKDISIQTSGIITTTGVLHVIDNRHIFYWR